MHNVASTEAERSAALERLWGVAILLSDQMQGGLAERGLTLARAAVIWQLQRDGPSTQHSLSRALRVTPRNITGLVDALEVDGIVARAAHPSDRRATLVSLTEKGAALARTLRREQDQFAQKLFDGVRTRELASFVKVLDRVLALTGQMLSQPFWQPSSNRSTHRGGEASRRGPSRT
jgi:DNA-binding MarR family transcriptional regulator